MMHRSLVALLVMTLGVESTYASGIFFGKKTKPDPVQRVPELLTIAQTDRDENKRIDAIVELKQYDPAAFPQITPILIQVLRSDPKPAVRSEAAMTLGKLKPATQVVGQALEFARDNDSAMRVRLQARSSLLGYYWAGYKTKTDTPPLQSKEPPLAGNGEPPLSNPPSPPQPSMIPGMPWLFNRPMNPTPPNAGKSQASRPMNRIPTTREPPLAAPTPAPPQVPPTNPIPRIPTEPIGPSGNGQVPSSKVIVNKPLVAPGLPVQPRSDPTYAIPRIGSAPQIPGKVTEEGPELPPP